MAIVDLLQQIGLNKYEAEAYYTLLTHGALTGYEVGKYSQVPGSRSYEILERLQEKGLALVQSGDPPRYRAQDPQEVFARFRSTMEATLQTLSASLAALTQADKASEFWVVRGRQHVVAQARAMIAQAQTSLDLVLPGDCDMAEDLAQAAARGCHIFRTAAAGSDDSVLLLIKDGRKGFVGTVTPPDACQAVLSSNAALLETLRGYFLHHRAPAEAVPVEEAEPFPSRDDDWQDWEARKQRHLRSVSVRNRVA